MTTRFSYPVRSTCVAITLLATGGAAGQPVFEDQTTDVGLASIHVSLAQAYGAEWWFTGGMAVGDFNRDGWPDVFCIGGDSGADKLFLNDGTGHFDDVGRDWGLVGHCGSGVAAGDFDGDGWLDVYVTSYGTTTDGLARAGAHRLYRNVEGSSFTDVATEAGVRFTSLTIGGGTGAAWGDYDLDGDLDLCVTQWEVSGDASRLYRNDGDGTFTDVTASALGSLAGVWGFQPVLADMDGDRYPELMIAADFESSRYFINDRDGTFTDHTVDGGLGLDDWGMGSTVGDVNNDGLLDWYVTSIHMDEPLPGDNVGNMLYLNMGEHQFLERSNESGCNDGGFGWGAEASDLDQDGWLDIVEENGRHDSPWSNEGAKLFYNMTTQPGGVPIFQEMAEETGFKRVAEGTAITSFDSDNDGDLDLLSFANNGPMAYYENVTPTPGAWLRVILVTSGNPFLAPDGFGTRLEATIGEETLVRYVDGRPNYLGTGEMSVHFGLGDADVVDELRLKWSRGYVTTLENVAVNQVLTIAGPVPSDINADGNVDVQDMVTVILGWGPCPPPPAACLADVNNSGAVDVEDLVTVLLNWH